MKRLFALAVLAVAPMLAGDCRLREDGRRLCVQQFERFVVSTVTDIGFPFAGVKDLIVDVIPVKEYFESVEVVVVAKDAAHGIMNLRQESEYRFSDSHHLRSSVRMIFRLNSDAELLSVFIRDQAPRTGFELAGLEQ